MPNELLLQAAGNLRLKDLGSFLRISHFFVELLLPVLLKQAVNTILHTHKRSVLHWASAHGRNSLVMLLLERGAQDNINTDSRGTTALHSAVIRGNENVVKLFLENGADTEVENMDGWTPLHCASIAGEHAAARLLLENGADIKSKGGTYSGETALHFAAALGGLSLVNMLVENGSNIEVRNRFGRVETQNAVVAGQEEVVTYLLGLGAIVKNGNCGGLLGPGISSVLRKIFL